MRRHPPGSGGSRHTAGSGKKFLLLFSFTVLAIVGSLAYLRALSLVSIGLDFQNMQYQERMMNLVSMERTSGGAKPKSSLRGEGDGSSRISSISNGNSATIQTSVNEPPPTPPWHIDSDPDDSFERIYVPPSHRKRYKHLRDLSKDVNKGKGIKHFFNPICRHYRFDNNALPTVSVVMTTQNEPDDWVSLSVESLLARTPPELLVDIIVVDDNGVPGRHGLSDDIRKNVDEEEWTYVKSLSPKVSVIQHTNREGCARSRLTGARAAKGEVLMFVDSHIEMISSTWYEHLAIPIVENPRTIAMQTIDVIDDLGSKDYGAGAGPLQYGIINNE